MKPQRLKPAPHERVETPQCCVKVPPPAHNQQWRLERYKRLRHTFDPTCCQRESSLTIGGKFYCRPHAAAYALELWEAGKLVLKK